MSANRAATIPFQYVVQQLRGPDVPVIAPRSLVQRETHDWRNVAIAIIDRPSPVTATVMWKDSTSCSYCDQIWREGVARRPGRCAFTGMTISPGDSIYRPIPAAIRPSNAEAMIHTEAILTVQLEA